MYGGRAKRIELAKKGALVLLCIVIIIVSVKKITSKQSVSDPNGKYELLKFYFATNGYSCTDLVASGGRCDKNLGVMKSEFIRYSDGFTYFEAGPDFKINIYYEKETLFKNGIYLKTDADALPGYQKKSYTCTTKGTILDEIDKCIDEEGNELDSNAYLNYVSKAVMMVKNALNSSGYNVEDLLNDFEWNRTI